MRFIKTWAAPGEYRFDSCFLHDLNVCKYESESDTCTQAVPVTPNSFDSRKKLPAEWCGLRDGVLSEKVQFIIMRC